MAKMPILFNGIRKSHKKDLQEIRGQGAEKTEKVCITVGDGSDELYGC